MLKVSGISYLKIKAYYIFFLVFLHNENEKYYLNILNGETADGGQKTAYIYGKEWINAIEQKACLTAFDKYILALLYYSEKDFDKSLELLLESVKENDDILLEMMEKIYEKLLNDLTIGNKNSPIFTHHIDYLNKPYYLNKRRSPYIDSEKNLIVVDYVASMTDDYFIDLFGYLFPKSNLQLKYKGYFN